MKRPLEKQLSPPRCPSLRTSLFVAIGLLGALQANGESISVSPLDSARRHAEAVFQVAARSDYTGGQDRVARRDAFVTTTHLRFVSPTRPIVAGMLVEHRLIDGHANTLLVGGMFSYRLSRWTASTSPFYKSTGHGAGDWQYWCGARRRIADRHALDIELFGSLETGRPEKWMLGYYRSITETLSVNVAAGTRFRSDSNWVARTSIAWRPRRDHR